MIGLLCTGASLLLAVSSQQGPTSPAEPRSQPIVAPATLHHAWLAEVLDLDSKRAIGLYTEVAQRSGPGNLDRWVAAARLLELQRLGVGGSARIDLAEAPRELRERFAEFQMPLDTKNLTQRASTDPEALLQGLSTEEGRLQPLRPIVPIVEAWLRDLIGQSPTNRSRQQRQPSANLFYANQILTAELAGRPIQADALRTLRFAAWKPPPVSNDHVANLVRFRANLDALLQEKQLGTQSKELLHRLHNAVDKAAEADPATATALLLRLPVYAERLLKETSPQGR